MTATVYDSARRLIRLSPARHRGGEGGVHPIVGQPRLLAKVYHRASGINRAKLTWMLANPPSDPTKARGHVSIAWPSAMLFDAKGLAVGFLMPDAGDAEPLFGVYNPKLRRQFSPVFSWRYLHRTARNLASAVTALHEADYVVGDVNGRNVLATREALVTLVDTDSFQVREIGPRGTRVHRCPVGTAEYTPPELQSVSFSSIDRDARHDRFGLAVLIFQLLMDGVHPFAAKWLGPGDPPEVKDRIKDGLFPFQTPPPRLVAPTPRVPTLEILHPELQALVRTVFIDGHSEPSGRPTADDWEGALKRAEAALIDCPDGHVFSNHLPACPWSARPGIVVRGTQTPLPTAARPAPPRVVPRTPPSPAPPAKRPVGPAPFVPRLPWLSELYSRFGAFRLAIAGAASAGIVLLMASWVLGGGGAQPVTRVTVLPTFRATATPRPTPAPTLAPDVATGCWTASLRLPALRTPDGSATYAQWAAPPMSVLKPGQRYVATIDTDVGTMTIELLPDAAPNAANNFACLAWSGFFDGSPFYQLSDAVIQAGDPSGTGTGGPGYRLGNDPFGESFTLGNIAAVNAGPDSTGSRFLVFLDDMSARLPPTYPVFARILKGLDVADAIDADTTSPLTIKSVTVQPRP